MRSGNEFIDNYGNFFAVEDTQERNDFLHKLERSKGFRAIEKGSTANLHRSVEGSMRAKPQGTSLHGENPLYNSTMLPKNYMNPKDLVYEKEDIYQIHEKLKEELQGETLRKNNYQNYRKLANQNPFHCPRVQTNMQQQPQVPFLHRIAPPLIETTVAVAGIGKYGKMGKFFWANRYIDLRDPDNEPIKTIISPEQKLNAIKFHEGEKWDKLAHSKLVSDQLGLKNNEPEPQDHFGYRWNPATKKLSDSRIKESPINQSAKNMMREKARLMSENVFVDNQDLKMHRSIDYVFNSGYEPKFQYDAGRFSRPIKPSEEKFQKKARYQLLTMNFGSASMIS
jgi:hypothetical protein